MDYNQYNLEELQGMFDKEQKSRRVKQDYRRHSRQIRNIIR